MSTVPPFVTHVCPGCKATVQVRGASAVVTHRCPKTASVQTYLRT